MGYLVISHRHELIPIANRLKSQGGETDLIVWRQRFERAWDGYINPTISRARGEISEETLDVCREAVANGETSLITNVYNLTGFTGRVFGRLEPQTLPASPIRIGGWWDGGLRAPHILFYDMGAWTQGMGAWIPGCVTMLLPPGEVDVETLEDLMRPITERLKAQDFKGLFNTDIIVSTEDASLAFHGLDAGWPFLQTHAFVSELENLGGLIEGEAPVFTQGTRFVVAIPVTVPPYPADGKAREFPIEGLTPKDIANYFWHDVTVDKEHGKLDSAGLDGLLGVARGAAWNNELARARALQRAAAMRVPEKQFRVDAAAHVGEWLGVIEQEFGFKF